MPTKTKGAVSSERDVPPVIPEAVTKQSVAVIGVKALKAFEEADQIEVKSDKDLERASQFLSNIKLLQKFVKQEKDKRLNPVKETKSWIEGLFSPIEDKIEAGEAKVKSAMAAYHDKQEAARRKAEADLAAKEAAGRIKPETAIRKREEIAEVKSTVKTTAGASTFSKVKKVRVIDASKVPDSYWIIDEVTLRSAALTEAKTQGKIGEVIPGVEVYEETIVGGRA